MCTTKGAALECLPRYPDSHGYAQGIHFLAFAITFGFSPFIPLYEPIAFRLLAEKLFEIIPSHHHQ